MVTIFMVTSDPGPAKLLDRASSERAPSRMPSSYPRISQIPGQVITFISESNRQFLYACTSGNTTDALRALEDGADPEIVDPKTKTSALTIARLKNNGPVAQIILDRILLKAAENGDRGKLVWALDEGANIEAKDPEFNATPIIFASINGHADCVHELKIRGADKNYRDDLGMDAVDWAVRSWHPQVEAILRS